MPKPGLLMRLAEPSPATTSPAVLAPAHAIPGIEAIYRTSAQDDETPHQNTLYFVSDIEPLLDSSQPYDTDLKSSVESLTSLSWIVLSFINGRDRVDGASDENATTLVSSHSLPRPLPRSSVIVLNGSTPRDDKEDDYHAWYDTEHGGKLANVPGWQVMRRYKCEKVYGETEAAKFYGMNIYDETNGLGGKEWKEGVTEWTLRIRDQAAKPNIRRVWTFEEAMVPEGV